jgi:hypothetical protein
VQVVLGEFGAQQRAHQAVRELERHNVSIQNVVIADRTHRTWRRLPPPPGRHGGRERFAVVMIGDAEEIDRVREAFDRVARAEASAGAASNGERASSWEEGSVAHA